MKILSRQLVTLLVSICMFTSTLYADNTISVDEIDSILATIPEEAVLPVWSQARELAELGDGYEDALTLKLEGATPAETVAVAYALMSLGAQRDAALKLEELIKNKQAPLERRFDACAVLGSEGGGYAKARLRSMLKSKELEEMIKVKVAEALWQLSYAPAALTALTEIAENSNNVLVAEEAVLTLGRIGRFKEAREMLAELAKNPGRNGQEAALLLKLDNEYTLHAETDDFAEELIGEVVEQIRTRYAFDTTDPDEAEQLKSRNLASIAAKKLVRSIDDFNDYLDEEDYQEMLNSMHGDYGGIGAYVGMREELFTVLSPMWGKPAFKAGLKAMDVIIEIDGEDITDMELSKIIQLLKGKPGSEVTVKIVRAGWDEPREVVIQRDLITLPMLYSQMLPGNIGYILLTGFQDDPDRRVSTSSELHQALIELLGQGMEGLILDLRNNPGGLLSEAVKVSEEFLERNKLIVYSKGKISKQRNYESRILGDPTFTGPMVVLVNGGSASASEIVSGALRDHKRATLVGTKTYGKGSVQMLMPVEATGGNTRLKLTIAKYYLPNGECIHGRDKGIKPHVEQDEPEFSGPERKLRIKQLENRDIAVWLEKNFDYNKDQFIAAMEFDNNDPAAYPGFDELYAQLVTAYPDIELDKDMVRRVLRSALFNFIRESRGLDTMPVDLQASEVLQRAILIMGDKLGALPDVPVYNTFKDKFNEVMVAEHDGAEVNQDKAEVAEKVAE